MSLISSVLRLAPRITQLRNVHTTSKIFFQSTPVLCAEPLKKKKKIDPQLIKQREERRRKKIEKQIRRLEKNSRQLKPIDELETPYTLIDEKKIRTRSTVELTPEILEKRVMLEKSWTKYKMHQKINDLQKIDQMIMAQEKALNELRFESEELYQEAIQPDVTLIPFKAIGTVATPPIENYNSPDGEYIDTSKKFDNN